MKSARRPETTGIAPILTTERERELISRVRDGDRQAREDLVLANLRLVASIAGEYRPRGMEVDDLIQEGSIALIGAVEQFDPAASSMSFAAFAARAIHRRLQRVLAEGDSMIRVPYYLGLLRRRFERVRAQLLAERRSAGVDDPSEPSFEDVAHRMGAEAGQLDGLRDAEFAIGSYSVSSSDDDELLNDALAREQSPEDLLEFVESMRGLYTALKRLSRFEAWVIKRLYYLDGSAEPRDRRVGRPYRDLSRECRLSISRIKRVEREALAKLAAAIEPATLAMTAPAPRSAPQLAG